MAAAAALIVVPLCLLLFFGGAAGSWCVVRSDASDQALQTALDYACGAGADCSPLQSTGLCFLPNTVQAHASYAFNSYYQRKGGAPDSCSFAGTSTIARTDPSYGSCIYPASPRAAGGMGASGGATPGGSSTSPITAQTPPPGTTTAEPLYGGGGGSTPNLGPGISDSSSSCTDSQRLLLKTMLLPMTLLLVF